eukprot:3343313-Ditylum_brightwellii.AAC.1
MEVQISFLQTAEQKFKGSNDSSTKLRTANQRSGASTLSQKKKKDFEKARKQGKGVSITSWRKLTNDERDTLKKARPEKKTKDEGLGAQYSVHQQLANLPSGTVLVSMTP